MNEHTPNKNIVIPIKIERIKLWARCVLEASTWLICLGLLAGSIAVAAIGTLTWLVSGSEIVLSLGLGSSLLMGLSGIWHLLRKLDLTLKQMRRETACAG